MSHNLPFLQASTLPVHHAFFTREGGVSAKPYATLNGGWNTDDAPEQLRENWSRFAKHMKVAQEQLWGVEQVHGAKVVEVGKNTQPWSVSQRPQADALVTTCPQSALSITTADCAPVLLSSDDGCIVGAAHAGWRGAVSGVLEATVKQMRRLGARQIKAAIGPCIAASSYEVGEEMASEILTRHPQAERFFTPARRAGHAFFNLPQFCVWRLEESSVTDCHVLPIDTCTDRRFFSYRRACLEDSPQTGRQISAIRPFLRRF